MGKMKQEVLTLCPHSQELVIRVTLPGVSSVSAVQLDVSRTDISVHVPGKFLLPGAPLPFQVDSDRGRAKFDKAKAVLEVVVPLVPPAAPPPSFGLLSPAPPPLIEPVINTGEATEPEPDESSSVQGGPSSDATLRDDDVRSAEAGGLKGGVRLEESAGGALMDGSSSIPSIKSKTAGTTGPAVPGVEMTENQRRWAELHPQLPSTASVMAANATAMVTTNQNGSSGASTKQPPPAPPAVITLKPRLKSSIADELD